MSFWGGQPTCKRCGEHHSLDEPRKCPVWALERRLLCAMIDTFESKMSADLRLVLSVAGGIPISLWPHVVAILATNLDAASQMADRLRAIRREIAA